MQRRRDRAFASAQEMLPLDDVVDGVLCLRGGDYRAVLEAQSVNFALKSDSEQEAIDLIDYHRKRNKTAHESHRKTWLRKHKRIKPEVLL